jgi:regulatory protein
VRERTTSELEQRLQRDGIPDGLAEAAIERAVNCGLVDEVRFTEAFLRGKIASGWGRRRIERELARFGVNEDALERFLEDCPQNYFSEESELERAIVQLNRFHSTARNISDARYRRLAQKGYDSEVIRQALASYTDSCSPSS